MTWFSKNVKTADFGAWNTPELLRGPLVDYIQKHFRRFDPRQMLMFGLTNEELVGAIVDKIMEIPIEFEYTTGPENPSGTFHAEEWKIDINGMNLQKYKRDRAKGGYQAYVDSAIFHEMVHAVDWLLGAFENIGYDSEVMGAKYYSDPEEARAYTAQMRTFLVDFLGIPPKRVSRMMAKWTTDKESPARKTWLDAYLKTPLPVGR